MSRIAFVTLGCKLNYAETSTYERGLVAAGWEVVPWSDASAGFFLVNTCSVTEHSDKKSRNIIRKLHRLCPDAGIVVTGCSAELRRSDIERLPGVLRVFGATEKSAVVPFLLSLTPDGPPAALARRPKTFFSRVASGSTESILMLSARAAGLKPAGPASKNSLVCLADAAGGIEDSHRIDRTSGHPRPDGGGGAQACLGGADCLQSGFWHPMDASEAAASQSSRQDYSYFRAWSSGERTRSFLKVQDGCDYKCHYCTVPYARGESRNAPIAEVVEDARAIAAQGIKEIVITGVNTGDFGKSTGETFFELLKALDRVEGIERYRISSIEPNLLTEEIIDWIAAGSKVLPHFHIPLQSGCDEVLKAMGRRYLTADFARKIEYIRKALERPGQQKVFFGIDVIVGFPGETDELFQQTYDFLKNVIKPAFIHIFPYSKRPGTPAAGMKNQVQDSVKTGRVERLEALCDELHTAFVAANKGCRSKVLFEQKTRDGMAEGWSENYIKVTRPWKEGIVNSIEEIEL